MSRFDQGATGPSQRQLRVGELIRHELSSILSRGEVADPDLDGDQPWTLYAWQPVEEGAR